MAEDKGCSELLSDNINIVWKLTIYYKEVINMDRYIEIENTKLMRELRNDLDMSFYKNIGFNPEFYFHDHAGKNTYSFYMKNKINTDKSIYSIELSFSIHYEDKLDILYRYEKENDIENITEEKLDNILKKISDIKYLVIDWLDVNPTGIGMGTKLMNTFITRLRKIEKLEKVYLSPKLGAVDFWNKIGFDKSKYYRHPKNMIMYSMELDLKK